MSFQPLSGQTNRSVAANLTRPAAAAGARCNTRRMQVTYPLIAFWLVALACVFASTASGQQAYQRVELDKRLVNNSRVTKSIYSHAKNFAAGRDSNADAVKLYFENYVPATLTNPEYSHDVSEMVDDYNRLLEGAKGGSNHGAINTLVYSTMGRIASGNYSPSARINAIHALASLDSKPANRSAGTPPVPYGRVLLGLVPLYRDTNNSDGVRAAALHGIDRHVNYGFQSINDEMKSGLAGMMTELLDEPAPQGRSPEAHAYLQRFAVDILEKLRGKGDSTLGEKLISISTEKSKPDLIALHSAAGIGEIGPDLKGKVADPAKVLDSWSRRALSVMETELHRLQSLDRAEPAGGQPPNPGDYSAGGGSSSGSSSGATAGRTSGGGFGALEGMRGSGSRPSKPNVDESSEADGIGNSGLGALSPLGDSGKNRRDRRTERPKEPIPGENQPPEVVASRRLLNHALEQLKLGVTGSTKPGMPPQAKGLYASATDEAKPAFETWILQMQNIFDEVNSDYLETRKAYVEMLQTQVESLREKLGEAPSAEPKKPAEPENPAEPAAEPVAAEPVAAVGR